MNAWEKVGTIAAVVAALTGAATFILSRRALTHSKKTVLYERLRDARELVGSMLLNGNNVRWAQCNEAGAQLRGVVARSGCRLQRRRSSRPWSGTWTHITRGGFRSSSPEPSASFKKQRGGSDEIAWCLPRCLPRRWKTLISRGVRIPYGPFRGAWLCENAWLRGQTCQALGRSIISAEQQNDRATRVLSPLANRLSGGSQSPPKMPILRLQRERGAPRNHPQLRGTHENPHHGCDHSVDPCALSFGYRRSGLTRGRLPRLLHNALQGMGTGPGWAGHRDRWSWKLGP